MVVFKDYDGAPIDVSTHKHSVTDTKRDGSVAIASIIADGFMSKEDRIRLTSLKSKMDTLNDRMQVAVYIADEVLDQRKAILAKGNRVNNMIKLRNITSLSFINEKIPDEYKASATLVSDSSSDEKIYLYEIGDKGYISPENDNTIIQANEDCSEMFHNCTELTSINLSNFDTSNVKNMYRMFNICRSLTSLDLSNFNTSKVTKMNDMFCSCYSLTSLDLSNFNTSNVTDMSRMFYNCTELTSLNVSNFDTSNVTTMNSMFSNCSALTSLNLSNFNTSKVTGMTNMFGSCNKLTSSIIIMNPDITNYSVMFSNCSTDQSAKFTVNYKSGCQTVAQNMVNTKSSNSNVVLGSQV